MKRWTSQPSPNLILLRLPNCEDTADQIIRDVIEGQPDATRRPVVKGEAA